MAGIESTSGITPPEWQERPSGTSGQKGQSAKTSFGEALKSVIDRVDADQQVSAEAIRDLITGKSQDILPVVQAVAKADLSFKLLMGVRNKIIEAYKQTMQMQV